MFVISQLWLTSHRKVQSFYWTQELLSPVKKFKDDVDSNSQHLGSKSSALAIELDSSKAIAGKELSLSSWCIASLMFIISQLWLTFHPRSTVVLLYTGTPGTSREIYSEDANDVDSNSQPLGYKPSALSIELNNSKAIARKGLSLSSWCIASLYVYHFSAVVDFSSEKYSGSTDTGTAGTS